MEYFNSKDVTFYKCISVKCILWQIFHEIVDNQDLYICKMHTLADI